MANVDVGEYEDSLEEAGGSWFRRYFDIARFEKGGWKFDGTISPDGKGVSVLLRRLEKERSTSEPPLPKSAQSTELSSDSVIWGVDPGRSNMLTSVNNREDMLRGSMKQFYYDAKQTFSKKDTDPIYQQNLDTKDDLHNMPTNKTAILAPLVRCAWYPLPRLYNLLRFRRDKAFRGLCFMRHQSRQKALNGICKEFTKKAGRKTIVGWWQLEQQRPRRHHR